MRPKFRTKIVIAMMAAVITGLATAVPASASSTFTIKSDGYCANADLDGSHVGTDLDPVIAYSCNTEANEKWSWGTDCATVSGDKYCDLINGDFTSYCLNINTGTQYAQLYTCNKSPNDLWWDDDGTYFVDPNYVYGDLSGGCLTTVEYDGPMWLNPVC
jgi:hypothetical protein